MMVLATFTVPPRIERSSGLCGPMPLRGVEPDEARKPQIRATAPEPLNQVARRCFRA